MYFPPILIRRLATLNSDEYFNHACIFSPGIILICINFKHSVSADKTLKVQFYTWISPSLTGVESKANINQIHTVLRVTQLTWRQILKTVSSLQVVKED